MGVLERCYEHFDLPVTAHRLAAVRAWTERDRAQHSAGPRHRYDLAEIDMDYAAIDAVMRPYIERYGVQLER